MNKLIKSITISDKHIGHDRNPSFMINNNIKQLFKENEDLFKECDILIDLGDSSDSLLSSRSKEYQDYLDIHLFIADFCNKYNIKYLYLAGTPLHEMEQYINMEFVIKKQFPKLDFRLYNKIGIDIIKEFDLSILHVPDGVFNSSLDLKQKIDKVFKNTDKVDLALTHTMYRHHMNIPLDNIISEEVIKDKVKYFILNGHVHKHQIYDKFITIGSTDRLAHNEEDDKGMGYLYLHPNKELSYYKQIINPYAMKFITINKNYSLPKLKDLISKFDKKYTLSYIQFGEKSKMTSSLLKELNKEYRNVVLEMQRKSKKVITSMIEEKDIEVFEINEHNIYDLLKDRIKVDNLKEILNKHISLIRH